jgi:DNA-binding transcriptional ArsR family regulator
MADAGEEPKRGELGKKKPQPGKRARKAKASQRRKRPNNRRQLIAAIAHPVRRCVLHVLHNSRESRSPASIAREFDLPLGTVAYHANVLARLGALKLAGERQARDAVEHFYDSTIEDPTIESLLEETQEADDKSK